MATKIERGKDNDRILRLLNNMPEILQRTTRLTREDVVDSAFNEAQKTVPVDRATLQNSGNVRHSPKRSVITYSAPYATAVHEGTKPHVIEPKTKKALRFEGGGGRVQRLSSSPRRQATFVFAKRVKHPGTKPNPWLIRAVIKKLDRWGEFWDKNFNSQVRRFGG